MMSFLISVLALNCDYVINFNVYQKSIVIDCRNSIESDSQLVKKQIKISHIAYFTDFSLRRKVARHHKRFQGKIIVYSRSCNLQLNIKIQFTYEDIHMIEHIHKYKTLFARRNYKIQAIPFSYTILLQKDYYYVLLSSIA